MNESLKFLKAIFSFKCFFPRVFSSFFELTIQTWLFGKLNVCKTCKPCPFGPFAPIFFLGATILRTLHPLVPAGHWHIYKQPSQNCRECGICSSALDFLPRVNLARHSLLSPQNYHNPKAAFTSADIYFPPKRPSLFCDKFFARHERQNQEGKHVGMLSLFQRQLIAVDECCHQPTHAQFLMQCFEPPEKQRKQCHGKIVYPGNYQGITKKPAYIPWKKAKSSSWNMII